MSAATSEGARKIQRSPAAPFGPSIARADRCDEMFEEQGRADDEETADQRRAFDKRNVSADVAKITPVTKANGKPITNP